MYVKVTDGQVERYPYTPTDLILEKQAHVSFPAGPLSDALLAVFGVFPVQTTEPPAHDPATQNVTHDVASVDGTWVQTWTVSAKTPAEVEAYRIATTPAVVSMRQARLALLQAGLLDDVNQAIGTLGQAAQIEWEYASEVQRNSPLVAGLASGLSLTEAQLDDLFKAAAAL